MKALQRSRGLPVTLCSCVEIFWERRVFFFSYVKSFFKLLNNFSLIQLHV